MHNHFNSTPHNQLELNNISTFCKYILVNALTHWGRMTHICVSKLTIIGSDNGLSPGRCQAIIWTNDGILWIGPSGTKFSEILIKIYIFSFKKMHLKMSSGKCRLLCLGLNVLRPGDTYMCHQMRSSLVQIMACCLLGAKPLSEPMLDYC